MADTRREWRGERADEQTERGGPRGWLDDRGVSEVIGSILVFGLLVSLLAIVQTQAVPNANAEVEAKHSADVQGDLSNLQSAIIRTGTFGGAESTTVETGMTYPPRLVLYNPPSVQGVLSTDEQQPVALGNITASNDETGDYLDSTSAVFRKWNTSSVSYRVNYNRYNGAPTVRYEHTSVVNDFGDQSTVESRGSLINGNRISLVLVRDGLEETGVRPASVTTYPVSAPAQTVDVEVTDDESVGIVQLPTEINESIWATELLAGQYDTNAFAQTPAERGACGDFGSSAPPGPGANVADADPDDGRFVVGCDYATNAAGQSFINIYLQNESTYDLAVSRVGFRASSEPLNASYLTDTASTPEDVTFELRDRYNNPVEKRQVVNATAATDIGTTSPTNTTYNVGANGRVDVSRTDDQQAVVLRSGPNAFNPANTSLSPSDCLGHPGCALIQSADAASPVPEPIELVDASISANDQVNMTVRNKGTPRQVTNVSLNYVTVHEQKRVAETANPILGTVGPISGVVTGVDITLTNATDTTDGPDSVDSIVIDRTGEAAVGGAGSLASPAVETEGEVEVVSAGSFPAVPTDETADLVLTFDESIEADMDNAFGDSNAPSDMLAVSVTVTYNDGYQTTYTTNLHAPEDDER